MLGLKKFVFRKKFCSDKILGPEKLWVRKNNLGLRKNLGPTKILGPKNVGSKKMLGQKKNLGVL